MLNVNLPNSRVGGGKSDGRNLFAMATATQGSINEQGIEGPPGQAKEKTCDYISVKPLDVISVRTWVTAFKLSGINNPIWINFLWYDSQKTFISHNTPVFGSDVELPHFFDVSYSFTAPENAAYLRVSSRFYNDGRIKVERGSIATEWTPAPEDVVVRSELDALIKRVAALEAKEGITSADSFMESPSMDVMESGSETASADDAEDDTEIN